jgi:hypothetical protein
VHDDTNPAERYAYNCTDEDPTIAVEGEIKLITGDTVGVTTESRAVSEMLLFGAGLTAVMLSVPVVVTSAGRRIKLTCDALK